MINKISILTPCLNSLPLLKETVFSVIHQKALVNRNVELEYIICDGGSDDGSIEWLESLDNASIKIISEKDIGIYDALSKGLNFVTGDIIAYLNAGDFYSPHAFNILMDVFLFLIVKK
jgi:glycosyltransferase involved in cell wall biosynthesis